MKYLFENIQTVNEILQTKKRIILLTDYDGTLTPIREHPDLAILSEEVRQVLIKFSNNKTFLLGIITGRSLKQIKKLVNIRNVLYAANYGIELEGPGIRFTCPEAKKACGILGHIYMKLFKSLRQIKGIYVENKGLSINLHYRTVKKRGDVEQVDRILRAITKPFLDRKMLLLHTGKMVYEIRPPVKWNKASTIQWLLTHYFRSEFSEDALLIYLGDDKADIEVFDSLRGKGLTIFVGNPSDISATDGHLHTVCKRSYWYSSPPINTSVADYYVYSPGEVKVFLEHLYEQKHEVHNECPQ